jgi:hypothetical protein
VPVIAGGVERIVDALPRGTLGFLKQNAHVPPLVGDLRSSAEMVGDRRKQLVGTPPRARHVDDDRGQRHQSRSSSRAAYTSPPELRGSAATGQQPHRGRDGSRRVGSGRAHSAAARCCSAPRRRAGRGRVGAGRRSAASPSTRCAWAGRVWRRPLEARMISPGERRACRDGTPEEATATVDRARRWSSS